MPETFRRYTRDGVADLWQPEKCIHSGISARRLSAVFNARKRPLIDMAGAATNNIAEQVKKCPGGALSLLNK